MSLLHLPNQIRFQIGRECAICRGSKTYLFPWETTTWTFWLDLENLSTSQLQANYVFTSCLFYTWVGRYHKPLNDWPHKKQWVFLWNKTHRFPWGQSLRAFQSMIKHEMFALIRLAWKVSVAFEFRWKRKCGWIFPSSHFYQCGKRRFWFWILNMFSSCHWMNLVSTMVYMVV